MSIPDYVAEDRDNDPNSARKRLLQGPEEDRAGTSLDKVRGEWRRLYRCEAPRISRDLLLRGIAYLRECCEEARGKDYEEVVKIVLHC